MAAKIRGSISKTTTPEQEWAWFKRDKAKTDRLIKLAEKSEKKKEK